MDIFRMGILGLNMMQKVKEYLRVFVEENDLKSELLTHILPVPALIVQIREGGVELEKQNGLVSSSWI